MSKGLASQASRKLGERVSGRYLQFLRREQYERLAYLHLSGGGVEGWMLPNFRDHRSLYDIERLGRVSGIDGLSRARWNAQIPELAPLATLEAVVEEGPPRPVGALLAMGLQPLPCPVYLIVGAALRRYPLGSTLDAFTNGEAPPPHRVAWAPEPCNRFLRD